MANELLDRIKADALSARKARDTLKANLLNTLASEVSSIAASRKLREGEVTWPATEDETKAILVKFIKNTNQTIADLAKAGRDSTKETAELALLMEYMPRQMSDDELQAAVQKIVAGLADKSPKSMGAVMGQLKGRYDGQYDSRKASEIVKASLV